MDTTKTIEDKVIEIARILENGKGRDVTVLNISQLNSWTDYFIIVTVSSSVQWQGMYKDIRDYVKNNALQIRETNRKPSEGNDWNLIDLGPVVVHFMSEDARKFYDLEKLWHAGTKLDIN